MKILDQAWQCVLLILAGSWISEFEASPIYKVSSRTDSQGYSKKETLFKKKKKSKIY